MSFKPTHIIVHHSASSADTKAVQIMGWHIQRGFTDIGYHKIIEGNGTPVNGRPEKEQGAHNKHGGFNRIALGICVTGNLELNKIRPAQFDSLVRECAKWCILFDIEPDAILGHKETGASTLCPGKHLDMDKLRLDVANVIFADRGNKVEPKL